MPLGVAVQMLHHVGHVIEPIGTACVGGLAGWLQTFQALRQLTPIKLQLDRQCVDGPLLSNHCVFLCGGA